MTVGSGAGWTAQRPSVPASIGFGSLGAHRSNIKRHVRRVITRERFLCSRRHVARSVSLSATHTSSIASIAPLKYSAPRAKAIRT